MKALVVSAYGLILAVLQSWILVPAVLNPGVIPEWVERLGWTLVHSTWQMVAVAIVAGLLELVLKRRNASSRYVAGVMLMTVMASLPCLTWAMLEIAPRTSEVKVTSSEIREVPSVDPTDVQQSVEPGATSSHEPDTVRPSLVPTTVSQAEVPLETGVPSGVVATAGNPMQDYPATGFLERCRTVVEPRLPWLVLLWLAGVALFSLRPICGLWTQSKLRRTGLSPVSDDLQRQLTDLANRMGLTRVVRIVQSAQVAVPMVVGYLRPMILLPASVLTGLTPIQLQSLLAHELAHVRRHDWLVNAFQIVVETLLFYHPAVWWLSSRIRHERELCCDDIALEVIGDRATYGRMLLALEELRQADTATALAAGSMAGTGGNLVQRVRRLLPQQRVARPATRGLLSGTTVLCLLAVAGIWVASRATAEHRDLNFDRDSSVETVDAGAGDVRPEQRSGERAQLDPAPSGKFDPTVNALQSIARQQVRAKDWPQWCGSPHRNNTPAGENIPTHWDLKTGENVLWTVKHSKGNLTTPVVANGKVFVGGNNLPGFVSRFPKTVDLGCLRAHNAVTGELLWQANHSKLDKGKDGAFRDWPTIGICSPPTVEGDRLWYVSNRSDVVCLDTEGFRDGENDGPFVGEANRDPSDADFIWQVDLVKEFQVEPFEASASTVLCVGNYCYVITSNGVGADHQVVVNPQAPTFVCLNKHTGQVVWTDNSPGANILAGCWSSPCAFEINGETQVVMAGGDGWLYSFSPDGDGHGHARLLWKFDANPKKSRYLIGNRQADRSSILATPVFYDGRIYVGVGESPEHGEGPGRLWCLDPTRRGDVSPELAVDANDQPLPARRVQAVDPTSGEKALPNPNSAAVWCYTGRGRLPAEKVEFEQTMHRTLGNVVIKNDLLFITDFSGLLHCLDARRTIDGQPVVYWTHDLTCAAWGTPLIVDGKVYVGDEDGDILIFALAREKQLIAENNLNSSIQTTPIVANDTLFVNTVNQLIAFKQSPRPKAAVDAAPADRQFLTWSMLIDGTLADEVAGQCLGELPRQDAFRVLQFDAARLRQIMFAPAQQAHIHTDVGRINVLETTLRENDRRHIHLSDSYQILQTRGGNAFANSSGRGTYLALPGQPLELDLQQYRFELDATTLRPKSRHRIKPQSLRYRGDLPIGSAVAFVGKTEQLAGERDFQILMVYEAVPSVTEPMRRLLADLAWFKSGTAREQAVLQQAADFNARAAKIPQELPARWAKPLPNGGSVSLIAVARPATHPFCWWDADGVPRSVDWSLQQHALGRTELMGLVCVRDPASPDSEQMGITYVTTANFPPLPLYSRWGDFQDSSLYLVSFDAAVTGQESGIGIHAGAGPWKELGPLRPKKEITYGAADYALGELRDAPESEVHLMLGRRYLPDEEIRLRLIDKQGKTWPAPLNHGAATITTTKGIPTGWDGWESYRSELKQGQLDRVLLDSRPRHWVEFTGVASKLSAVNGDELPKLNVARIVAPENDLKTQLTGRFDRMLLTRYGDVFRDEDRRVIVEDFRRFVEHHMPASIPTARQSAIVDEFGDLFSFNLDYLNFFPAYVTLKWRLWMALNPSELSSEQVARREQQRDEWRKFIRAIPTTDTFIIRTHGHAIQKLEQLFDSPWHGWFHEPLSDAELAQMAQDQKQWNLDNLTFVQSSFDTIVMRVKEKSIQNDPRFGAGSPPLDPDLLAEGRSALLRFQTRFANQAEFQGPIRDLVYDDGPQSRRRILDFFKEFVEPPATIPPGRPALEQWAVDTKVGVLAYDAATHGLVTLRGAKLGVLPVTQWHEADRLSDAELFRTVTEQARNSILLTDYFGPRPTKPGYGPTPNGPLLVVESADGDLGVVQVDAVSRNGITAHLRARPGARRDF
ncbi:MAG: PQQ-binding-like beta-propeller repeat protein [Planctomycetes bacterium]|nr:PQQ-binding-like beta-propeller repeat protein [Planctomycetota bacterium]